jgi:predicted benzoate:H+ symporter BenE
MSVNVEPKPTAAFALSIVAGLITLLATFLTSYLGSVTISAFPTSMVLIVGSLAGIATIVGSWLLYSNAAQRKLGSILVLVFSIISMNFVSIVLGLIGGFLGFSFKGTSSTGSSSNSSSSRGYNPP